MLASSGYVAQVDEEMCAARGLCTHYCQFAAISLDDGFARIDVAACMGCGVRIAHCLELRADRGHKTQVRTKESRNDTRRAHCAF
jgi:heterodisulfide reductase subunit A-like polyferredoxin